MATETKFHVISWNLNRRILVFLLPQLHIFLFFENCNSLFFIGISKHLKGQLGPPWVTKKWVWHFCLFPPRPSPPSVNVPKNEHFLELAPLPREGQSGPPWGTENHHFLKRVRWDTLWKYPIRAERQRREARRTPQNVPTWTVSWPHDPAC